MPVYAHQVLIRTCVRVRVWMYVFMSGRCKYPKKIQSYLGNAAISGPTNLHEEEVVVRGLGVRDVAVVALVGRERKPHARRSLHVQHLREG